MKRPARKPDPLPGGIDAMRNLGPQSRSWLAEIGIGSEAELRAIGSVEAFLRLKFALGRKVSLLMLYAMEAALLGIDWRHLPEETKAALRAQLPSAAPLTEP